MLACCVRYGRVVQEEQDTREREDREKKKQAKAKAKERLKVGKDKNRAEREAKENADRTAAEDQAKRLVEAELTEKARKLEAIEALRHAEEEMLERRRQVYSLFPILFVSSRTCPVSGVHPGLHQLAQLLISSTAADVDTCRCPSHFHQHVLQCVYFISCIPYYCILECLPYLESCQIPMMSDVSCQDSTSLLCSFEHHPHFAFCFRAPFSKTLLQNLILQNLI